MIRLSHSSFPCTPREVEEMHTPWGACVQPLAPLQYSMQTTNTATSNVSAQPLTSLTLARCSSCYAYINRYIQYTRNNGWRCAVCREINSGFIHNSAQQKNGGNRYQNVEGRVKLEEMRGDVDVEWIDDEEGVEQEEDEDEQQQQSTASLLYSPSSSCAFIFLVDLSSSFTCIELLKRSLLGAIEALHPAAFVGLAVSAGTKVGMYDLRSAIPCVKYTTIRSAAAASKYRGALLDEQPISVPLASLLTPQEFFTRLDLCKEALCTAIESLVSSRKSNLTAEKGSDGRRNGVTQQADDDFEAGVSSSESESTQLPGASKASSSSQQQHPSGFGAALHAMLVYLTIMNPAVPSSSSSNQLSIRFLLFLTQRPNYGLGALPDRFSSEKLAEYNEDDYDKFLLKECEGELVEMEVGGSGDGSANNKQHKMRVSSQSASEFYKTLGRVASEHGVCIDMYCLGDDEGKGDSSSLLSSSFDLATLKFITLLTGGNLFFYPSSSTTSSSTCTLPQDLYRQLRMKLAWSCLLRIRTSPEYHAAHVYGHLLSAASGIEAGATESSGGDEEGLFKCGGGDERKTYTMEFEFRGTEGFRGGSSSSANDITPVLQIAYRYRTLHISPLTGHTTMQSRLRVMTRQIPCVQHYRPNGGGTTKAQHRLQKQADKQAIRDLYTSLSPPVILTLLIHQIIHLTLDFGLKETRERVKDWIVTLVGRYEKYIRYTIEEEEEIVGKAKAAATTVSTPSHIMPSKLDLQLSSIESLQFIPRFIFGLLKSPLLLRDSTDASTSSSHTTRSITPDSRVYLHCLYSGLEGEYLVKTVYPALTSFRCVKDDGAATSSSLSPSSSSSSSSIPHDSYSLTLHHPVLYLSRSSLSGSGDSIFLLDNYRGVWIAQLNSSTPGTHVLQHLPPQQQQNELMKHIKQLKQHTPYLTPRVEYANQVAGTVQDVQNASKLHAFYSQLIEDGGAAMMGKFTYAQFLEEIAQEVCQARNAEIETMINQAR